MLGKRKPISKGYILYDSIHITFQGNKIIVIENSAGG